MLFVGVVAKAQTAEEKLDHLPGDFAVLAVAGSGTRAKVRASRYLLIAALGPAAPAAIAIFAK